MRRSWLVALVWVVAACGPKAAPAPKEELPTPPRYLGFTPDRYGVEIAENKLRVLVVPDLSTHLVEVGVRYEVGAAHDPEGKEGLAHLVEHMLFQPRAQSEGQETLGERLAQIAVWHNAVTMHDATHYMAVAPKDRLEEVLQLEVERMTASCESLSDEAFVREREVVRNEMRSRREQWAGRWSPGLVAAIYPDGHPYRRSVGGDDESIASITRDDVCAFIDEHYAPSRAIVVMSGHVERRVVKDLIERLLRTVPPRDAARVSAVPAVLDVSGVTRSVRAQTERTTVSFLWPLPPPYTPERLHAEIVLEMLPSYVAREAREDELWVSASTFTLGGMQASIGGLAIELPEGAGRDEARALVERALERRARALRKDSQLIYRKILGLRTLYLTLDPLIGRTLSFADYVQFDDDLSLVQGDLERIDRLSAKALREAATTISIDRAAVIVVEPAADAGEKGTADSSSAEEQHDHALWMPFVNEADADKPLAQAMGKSPLPRAKTYELDNGLRVVLLHMGYAPVVRVDVVFGVGAADESADESGFAQAAADLLVSGTGSEEIGSPTEVGATERVMVDRHVTRFSYAGLMPGVDWMIEGAARLISEGKYDPKLIRAYRKFAAADLERERYRRGRAIRQALFGALYGADHPYARDTTPTRDRANRWTRKSLDAFRRKHYVASNAAVIVTGRFDSDVARAHIAKHFGSWPSGAAAPDAERRTATRGGAFRGAVIDDGGEMLDVLIAFGATGGSIDDYAARLVVAEMISARMATLREGLGASYGVHASFTIDGDVGRYTIAGSVDGVRAGEALSAAREGLALLRSGDTLRADFVYARRRVAERVLNAVSSSRSAADELVRLTSYGLPPAAHADIVDRLAALEPDRIEAIIRRDLDLEREIIVLQGTAETVAAGYTAIGVDDFTVIDVDAGEE